MDVKKVENKNRNGLLAISGFILLAILILAVGYKVNEKMEFYGKLINVTGGQRATTVKILNDVESALIFYNENEYNRLKSTKYKLFEEGETIDNYFEIMGALKEFSQDYSLSKAKSEEINNDIDRIVEEMYNYIFYVEEVLDNPKEAYNNGNYDLMVESSEICYRELDNLVSKHEENYGVFTNIQRNVIITCGFILVLCGFLVSHLLKKVKIIEFVAKYDYLTEVRNIGYLAHETKKYANEDYAIMFIDLNKFKQINDTFGHSVGDEILRETGKRLKKELAGNLVFRYGGDEFVVFVKNENLDKLESYIEKINCNVFSTVIDSCRREHIITGSIGVIGKDVTKNSVKEAVKIADSLMYKAKDEAVTFYAKTDDEVNEIIDGEFCCKSN